MTNWRTILIKDIILNDANSVSKLWVLKPPDIGEKNLNFSNTYILKYCSHRVSKNPNVSKSGDFFRFMNEELPS
jgi:hypothetical protein